MRRALLIAVGLCAGLTACGSTVSPTAQGALPPGQAQNGLQAPGAALDGSTTGAGLGAEGSGADGALAGGSSAGGPGAAGSASGAAGGSAGQGAAGAAPGGAGPLVVDYTKPATGSPVEVGIMYIADLGKAASQFGGSGQQNNEALDGQREYMQAAVDWMNARGGLGGHRIKLLYYGAEIAGSKSFEQSQAEMCAMMTEDHKVVASVISNITVTNSMAECMEKAKGLYVTDAGYFKSGADWKRLSYTASPTELDSEVLGREMANLTIGKALAKSGEEVGLVVYDAPGYRAAERAFTKVAAARGIKTRPYYITYANTTAELSNSIAAVQSAVLAFRSAGIKTVASLSSGGMMGFFLSNANEQRYYPRYVFSSNDGPVNAQATENDQLKGSIALGTVPTQDADLRRDPGQFADSVFATCRQINKQFPAATEDTGKFNISQRLCASLLLLQTAAKGHGGSDITGTTLRDGLRRVGAGIPVGATYRTSFGPGKQWAPSHYRSMRYDEAKNVFVYDSGFIPFT